MNLISVIIPTYKRPQYLNRTLAALDTQKLEPGVSFEVLVLDDDVQDSRVRSIAEFWATRMSLRYLKPASFGMGNGRTRIRNLGFREAKGDLIVSLDDDMIVTPTFLQEHFDSHKATADAVVIGYRYYLKLAPHFLEYVNPVNIVSQPEMLGHLPCVKDEREAIYKVCRDDLPALGVPWIALYSNNFSIRKTLLNRLSHGFDESFQGAWGGEDIEIGYRLFKAGGVYVLNRNAVGYHQWHYVNWKRNVESLRVNLDRFYRLHPCLETELYLDYVDNGIEHYIADCARYNGLRDTTSASLWDDAELIPSLVSFCDGLGKSRLVIGARQGQIRNLVGADASCDFRSTGADAATGCLPLMGVHLPFDAQFFDTVVIGDFLDGLAPYHAPSIVKEALRLSREEVCLLGRIDGTTSAEGESLEAGIVRNLGLEDIPCTFTFVIDGPLFVLRIRNRLETSDFVPRQRLALIVDSKLKDDFSANALELGLALDRRGVEVALRLENYSTLEFSDGDLEGFGKAFTDAERSRIAAMHRVDMSGRRSLFPQLSITGHSYIIDKRIEWLRRKTMSLMPSSTVHAINEQADQVWCPSDLIREVLVKSGGMDRALFFVPIGVERRFVAPAARAARSGPFRVLVIGSIEKPDGVDIAIRAFCDAFRTTADAQLIVRLLVQAPPAFIQKPHHHNLTAKRDYLKHVEHAAAFASYRIRQWRSLVKKSGIPAGKVVIKTVPAGPRSWVELYNDADCYLQTHRLDLIGDRIVQAGARGVPVIATGALLPGHLASKDRLMLIRSAVTSAAESEAGAEGLYSKWAEPDMIHVVKTLRLAYIERNAMRTRARAFREFILGALTWDRIAERLISEIAAHPRAAVPAVHKEAQLFSGLRENGLINIEEEAYEPA